MHKCFLGGSQIPRSGKLLHRLGDKSEWRAKIVGDIGKKHQLGARSFLQPGVESFLLLMLRCELFVFTQQGFLITFAKPKCPEYEEKQHTKHDYKSDAYVKQRCLRRMPVPVLVDFRFKALHLGGLLLQ